MEVVSCLWKPLRNAVCSFSQLFTSSLDPDSSLHFLTLPPPWGGRTNDRCIGKKRKSEEIHVFVSGYLHGSPRRLTLTLQGGGDCFFRHMSTTSQGCSFKAQSSMQGRWSKFHISTASCKLLLNV